jgi:hypothetical protein
LNAIGHGSRNGKDNPLKASQAARGAMPLITAVYGPVVEINSMVAKMVIA